MLGKLLKYEYKATSRYFIGLYIVLALLTIGNKIMLIIEDTSDVQLRVVDILFGIIMASYVIAIIAIAVATVVLMLRRFYFNMLKDEGYLTFTLPATVGQHIASKMIVCITWVIATVVSSVFLVICMHSLGNSYDISAFANQIFIFGIVLSIVVSIASYIATYYILSKKLNLE